MHFPSVKQTYLILEHYTKLWKTKCLLIKCIMPLILDPCFCCHLVLPKNIMLEIFLYLAMFWLIKKNYIDVYGNAANWSSGQIFSTSIQITLIFLFLLFFLGFQKSIASICLELDKPWHGSPFSVIWFKTRPGDLVVPDPFWR